MARTVPRPRPRNRACSDSSPGPGPQPGPSPSAADCYRSGPAPPARRSPQRPRVPRRPRSPTPRGRRRRTAPGSGPSSRRTGGAQCAWPPQHVAPGNPRTPGGAMRATDPVPGEHDPPTAEPQARPTGSLPHTCLRNPRPAPHSPKPRPTPSPRPGPPNSRCLPLGIPDSESSLGTTELPLDTCPPLPTRPHSKAQSCSPHLPPSSGNSTTVHSPPPSEPHTSPH